MTEYSRMAKGSFVSTGAAQAILLPFQPDRISLWNYTAYANFAAHDITDGYWDVAMGQGTAAVKYVDASTGVLETAVITSGGFSTFSGGLAQQFGPKIAIASATAVNPIVVTTTAAHGYSVGTTVIMQGLKQSSTTGMQQIAGIPFTISAVTSTTFTIKWNGSGGNYTALSADPAGAYVMQVLYPFLYVPQDNVVSAITTGTTTTVVTTLYHNFVVGQEIAFRIPTVWGTTQLNSLPNVLIPGQPIYGYVTSITDNWTFVCSINSTGYTAFNPNQPFANYSGEQFPQVLAVGDVNSGGARISAGSPLYPSTSFPTSSGGVATIAGPGILGAFVNNTSQGFIIGSGNAIFQGGSADTSSHLCGESADVVYWQAFLDDISQP